MRHPRRGGRLRRAAMVCAMLFGAVPTVATAGILDDLRGIWVVGTSGPPAMEWSASDGGFVVSWTPPDGKATTVKFAPSDRAGVYTGNAKAGWSMMDSMFGDKEAVNPLEGGELFWARTAGDGVYLYSLVIDDKGAFRIDRYDCRLDQGALVVSMARRTRDGTEDPREQRLTRAGQ